MSRIKDRLKQYKDKYSGRYKYAGLYVKVIQDMIEQLQDDLEQDEKENGWIPVSERLPESTLPVLCRVKSTTISCTETYIIGSYCNGYWFFQNDTVGTHSFPLSEYKVLAWMSLPEPYKED